MLFKIDGTFIVQLINFAIFFALLNVVFLRPVGKAIRERRRYIDSLTTDYDRYQSEGSAMRTKAEAIRAEARREAQQMLSKARGDASNQSSEIATQAATEVAKTVEVARRTVEGEVQSARADEARAVRELAELMLARTLSEGAR